GEDDDTPFEREEDDLADLHQTVLARRGRGEEDAGTFRALVVEDGVGGEVEDAIAVQVGGLEEAFRGAVADPQHALSREMEHRRPAFPPGLGEGAEAQAGGEEGGALDLLSCWLSSWG